MFNPLNFENAYKNCSYLPNTNPRCPQSSIPTVFLIQAGLENKRGSNLNKFCPEHYELEV